MRKTIILFLTIVALLIALVGCNDIENFSDTKRITKLEARTEELERIIVYKEIKEQANLQVGWNEHHPSELYFWSKEDCEWQDAECELYVLVWGQIAYSVGVRRKGLNIEMVDVEESITVTQELLDELKGK